MNKSKLLAIFMLSSLLCACQSNPNTQSVTSSPTSSHMDTEQTKEDSTSSTMPDLESSVSSSSDSSLLEDGHEYTVLEAIEHGEWLASQSSSITVIGYLPQAANVDEEGNFFAVILNTPHSNTPQERIRLEGKIDFGSCKAQITGTFFYNDKGEPCLNIAEAKPIPES